MPYGLVFLALLGVVGIAAAASSYSVNQPVYVATIVTPNGTRRRSKNAWPTEAQARAEALGKGTEAELTAAGGSVEVEKLRYDEALKQGLTVQQ